MITSPIFKRTEVSVDPNTITTPPGSNAAVTNTGTPTEPVLQFSLPRGDVGPANTLAIGTVSTSAGVAAATITGLAPNQTLDLDIPKGDAATVTVGTVSTGVAGSTASVTNSGTIHDAVLDFTIPRGDVGLAAVAYSATAPAGASAGDLWWKTDTKQLFLFNGSNWNEVNGNNDEYPVKDIDAINYINAVEQNDGQPLEQEVKDILMMWIANSKLYGIWDAIKNSCILAGARTVDGALTPLTGSISPTNHNFTPADYDRKLGLKGDKSSKYIDTNYLDSLDDKDDKHISVYITSVTTSYTTLLGGSSYGTGMSFIQDPRNGWLYLGVSANTKGQFVSGTVLPGLVGGTRDNSATFLTRRNQVTSSPISLASQDVVNPYTYKVFSNYNGAGNTDARMSFYSIGSNINLETLETRIALLMSQLNAAIL